MSKITVTNLRPRSLLHWTGLPIKAFLVLVARVAALLPSETRRGRPWTLLLDNCVLLAAIAWRTNLTHLWVADGTLIPVEDQKQTKCSKNYRRSVNVQLVFRARDRRVAAVGDAWTGNRNDIVVFRETMADQIAGHRLTIGDGAYRSHPGVITSKIKSKPFAKKRARAEHGIARLKDFEVLRRHRRRGETINDTTRAVAVLHNLKIDCA